ncbi:MAG TPA: FAD-binding oxidoreductase [Paracoccaceae bacterium]|nr:FAD-binding oxidoreductase [Paracoccaceae bacterium]HMO71135.1 FAD-binding oxidoreductase [Paracoccaceae bacterium]
MGTLTDATPDVIAALSADLPAGLLSAPEPRHLTEPRGRWQGRAGALARPRSVEEAAALVRAAARLCVGLVPWGGGTGLVGGQVAPEGALPVLVSMERMTAVRAVHAQENVLVIEAGATLAAAQAAATGAGRLFPLSLASEGSATVGGVLATNAGGVNVLRWGNARDLCLGLEAVMPDGSVWHGLRRLRKDNTGYDLRHLMIGSEGTLGLITAAALRLVPRPAVQAAALLAVPDPGAALDLLHLAEERLPGLVSAYELIGRAGFEFMAETMPELRCPFGTPPDWSVLVDLGLPAGLDPTEALGGLWEAGQARGLVTDAVMAQSDGQRTALWRLRESIPQANRRIGAVSSHDISLPLSELAGFIAAAGPALAALGPFRVNCFGHLGDGNLHYNVFPPPGRAAADFAGQRGAVKRLVHDMVHARGGSVSAEHGIGRLKVEDLARYGDPAHRAAMAAIKAALDPLGIMNPGALFGPEPPGAPCATRT